ncbi:YrhK family protein [Nocardioidaceae bacterium]|nr:YrhK family protein [Nocardioidaceae bacterium]
MNPLEIDLPGGDRELVLRRRYETASILNDLLIAVWFIVGSVLFFDEATATAGTWLFLIGSVQLAVRPSIRLARRTHLVRHRRAHGSPRRSSIEDDGHEDDGDY